MEMHVKIITVLYLIFNSGRVLSYLPQIVKVYNDKSSVMTISLFTWVFWTFGNFTTGLYTTFAHPDVFISTISYGNSLCCAILVGMVMVKRYKYAGHTYGLHKFRKVSPVYTKAKEDEMLF